MTDFRDPLIGHLERYLDEYEGSTPLPEGIRADIRAELPTTHQVPAWWPARRLPTMNMYAKLGLAAAAVAIAALLGYSYLFAPNVGGPGIEEPSPAGTPQPQPGAGAIDPGTYFMEEGQFSPVRYAFTVPAGWSIDDDGFITKRASESGELGIASWEVTHVFAHACTRPDGDLADRVDVGPTVDDLAAALAAHEERQVSGPTDTTVGGLPAKRVELGAPIDPEACPGNMRIWPNAGGSVDGGWFSSPGQTDVIYVLDVDGTRVVIATWQHLGSSEEDLAEQQAILDSIAFEQ